MEVHIDNLNIVKQIQHLAELLRRIPDGSDILWSRTGVTLSPETANDNIDIGSGTGTFGGFVLGGSNELSNVSESESGLNNDRLVTKGYVDELVSGGGVWTYIKKTGIDIGTEVVDTFLDTTGTMANWIYLIKNGINIRAGTIMAYWEEDTNVIQYTETTGIDLEDTSGATLSVDIDNNNVKLLAVVTSDDWTVKVRRLII